MFDDCEEYGIEGVNRIHRAAMKLPDHEIVLE